MSVCSSEVYNKNQETEARTLCVRACVRMRVRACVRMRARACVCVCNVHLYNFIYEHTSDMCHVWTDYKLLQKT